MTSPTSTIGQGKGPVLEEDSESRNTDKMYTSHQQKKESRLEFREKYREDLKLRSKVMERPQCGGRQEQYPNPVNSSVNYGGAGASVMARVSINTQPPHPHTQTHTHTGV